MIPPLPTNEETNDLFEEVAIRFSLAYGVPMTEAEAAVRQYYSAVESSWGDDYFHHEGARALVWETHTLAVEGLAWGTPQWHAARQAWHQSTSPLPEGIERLSADQRRVTLDRREAFDRKRRGLGEGWLPGR